MNSAGSTGGKLPVVRPIALAPSLVIPRGRAGPQLGEQARSGPAGRRWGAGTKGPVRFGEPPNRRPRSSVELDCRVLVRQHGGAEDGGELERARQLERGVADLVTEHLLRALDPVRNG